MRQEENGVLKTLVDSNDEEGIGGKKKSLLRNVKDWTYKDGREAE